MRRSKNSVYEAINLEAMQKRKAFNAVSETRLAESYFGTSFNLLACRPISRLAHGGQTRSTGGPLIAVLAIAATVSAALVNEELEIRKATSTLGKMKVSAQAASIDILQRENLQNKLVDLLSPYVCSMSHIDIVSGRKGTGRSTEIIQAGRRVPCGFLYVDMYGGGSIGTRLLQELTGDHHRNLLQSLCDLLSGGAEAHGVKLLEAAARRFVQQHERYPVVVFDHVDATACQLEDPASPILQLGRSQTAESPDVRSVIVLDDSDLEQLMQACDPSTSYRVTSMNDVSPREALSWLLQNRFPKDLACQVVDLVGGRMSHLQDAISYWENSSRWLSPMRPDISQGDSYASHYAEIKKIIFWDLDKRLRIDGGIGLWPSATGHAPVSHQSPTDEDAVRILKLLDAMRQNPVPVAAVRKEIGEKRLQQLLRAQILGFVPWEGPLNKPPPQLITLGSRALHSYCAERLASESEVCTLNSEAARQPQSGWRSWFWSS